MTFEPEKRKCLKQDINPDGIRMASHQFCCCYHPKKVTPQLLLTNSPLANLRLLPQIWKKSPYIALVQKIT